MKKGCFLTFTVLFTLIIGTIVYFVKYKKDFLKEFTKSKVINLTMEEFDKKLATSKATIYRDSLKNEMHRFFMNNEKLPFDTAMNRVQAAVSEAQSLLLDKNIDSLDFIKFKNHLALYERSKKN